MSDIYDLMAEEARQSFHQLENVTAALDSKAFGAVTADALLFSVFIYISSPFSNGLFYISIVLIIISFISLLASVWPRRFHRQFSDDTIKNYGTWDSKTALAQIAANYADLEREQYKVYKNKFNCFLAGMVLMVLAMISEIAIFAFVTLDP
jgi:hypothetical protein